MIYSGREYSRAITVRTISLLNCSTQFAQKTDRFFCLHSSSMSGRMSQTKPLRAVRVAPTVGRVIAVSARQNNQWRSRI